MTDEQRDQILWQLMMQTPGWVPPTEATLLQALARGEARCPFYSSIGSKGAIAILRVGDIPDDEFWDELGEYLTDFLAGAVKRRRERAAAAKAAQATEAPSGGESPAGTVTAP